MPAKKSRKIPKKHKARVRLTASLHSAPIVMQAVHNFIAQAFSEYRRAVRPRQGDTRGHRLRRKVAEIPFDACNS
jgi:hypothetical protein